MHLSMTTSGNFGQMASVILMLIGFSKTQEEAEAVVGSVMVTISLVTYSLSWIVTHIGRLRKGDVNVFGIKK